MGESETMLAQTGNESSLYTTNVNKQESLTHMEQIADFNASINAENVKDAENGITSDTVHDASALSAEEERLWSIVQTNSIDFNAWTALIEETEKILDVGNILKIRKVYDAFLAEFPLCYGYWKKYADHESHLGSIEKVVEVYERAVIGVTYSVDMWLHYCVFAINTYGDPETVRRLFERGLAYAGTDYQSFSLWDKYIEYEYTLQDWPRVALLYTRVLEIPNQQLDRYFEGFKELVARKPLSELWTAEEASAAANSESVGKETEEEGNNGNDVNSSLKDAEDLEKYIAIREELYKKTKDLDSKINGFETAIRRPYFHVRPLNVTELENWHNYLDFVEKGDEFDKVVKVYERCLIACANYPEYWKRYVLCMEANKNMDLANNALARATQVFVKRQPEIHLFAARFKHQHGDITGARAAYELVHAEISPGLLEAIIKHANMENRLGNLEDACNLYEQSIAIEKGKEHSQTLPLLYAQYSRFLYLVTGKVEKAREILDEAVKNIQLSKPLLEGLIHLESIQSLVPKRVEYLNSLVEKFTVPSYDHNLHVASIADREELSSIFLQFLDVFGDAEYIKKAEKRHAKLFLRHTSSPLESKKRVAEDDLMSEKSKLAKWTATGYGIDPQTQEWNAGYAAQQAAAYSGAYTGYATHPHPETYQTQVVVTQQSYAPVASLTSATVAPSAYYPTTYY